MGKLHVFEEIDERIPKRGEVYLSIGTLLPLLSTVDPDEDDYRRTILRRLTDEEVDALVTPKPADDERERFVRETAAIIMAHQFAMWTVAEIEDGDHSVSYSEGAIDQIVKAAESLAAKVFKS